MLVEQNCPRTWRHCSGNTPLCLRLDIVELTRTYVLTAGLSEIGWEGCLQIIYFVSSGLLNINSTNQFYNQFELGQYKCLMIMMNWQQFSQYAANCFLLSFHFFFTVVRIHSSELWSMVLVRLFVCLSDLPAPLAQWTRPILAVSVVSDGMQSYHSAGALAHAWRCSRSCCSTRTSWTTSMKSKCTCYFGNEHGRLGNFYFKEQLYFPDCTELNWMIRSSLVRAMWTLIYMFLRHHR